MSRIGPSNEAWDEKREQLFQEWKSHVENLLMVSQTGINVRKIEEILYDYGCGAVPYLEMGFDSLIDFLYCFRDSFCVGHYPHEHPSDPRTRLFLFVNRRKVVGSANNDVAAIADMVSNQRQAKVLFTRSDNTTNHPTPYQVLFCPPEFILREKLSRPRPCNIPPFMGYPNLAQQPWQGLGWPIQASPFQAWNNNNMVNMLHTQPLPRMLPLLQLPVPPRDYREQYVWTNPDLQRQKYVWVNPTVQQKYPSKFENEVKKILRSSSCAEEPSQINMTINTMNSNAPQTGAKPVPENGYDYDHVEDETDGIENCFIHDTEKLEIQDAINIFPTEAVEDVHQPISTSSVTTIPNPAELIPQNNYVHDETDGTGLEIEKGENNYVHHDMEKFEILDISTSTAAPDSEFGIEKVYYKVPTSTSSLLYVQSKDFLQIDKTLSWTESQSNSFDTETKSPEQSVVEQWLNTAGDESSLNERYYKVPPQYGPLRYVRSKPNIFFEADLSSLRTESNHIEATSPESLPPTEVELWLKTAENASPIEPTTVPDCFIEIISVNAEYNQDTIARPSFRRKRALVPFRTTSKLD